jgi:hypothetical protein
MGFNNKNKIIKVSCQQMINTYFCKQKPAYWPCYSIKMNKILSILLFSVFAMVKTYAQLSPQVYSGVSFYVCAHQDDWQLFMGSNAFKDIQAFDPSTPQYSSKKVVFIYTTSGNINEYDDSKSCQCMDPYDPNGKNVPYWMVREAGTKNSIHLAACRPGAAGPGYPYPENQRMNINGHSISVYHYKNTVSYYLRLKTADYGYWAYFPNAAVGTIDSSTTYINWADYVNTVYYIYTAEMGNDVQVNSATFNFQDVNTEINPNDHGDHYIAGKVGLEAAKLLSKETNVYYPESLYVDYHTQNLPENIGLQDCANKSALVGAYCLALLDYNAWAEFGSTYVEWSKRNYFRTINSSELPGTDYGCLLDDLDTFAVIAYPNPCNNQVNIKFNQPMNSPIELRITTVTGSMVYKLNTNLELSNAIIVNTANFESGAYFATVAANNSVIANLVFQVTH